METDAKTKTLAELQLTGGFYEADQDGNVNIIQTSGIADLTDSRDNRITKANGLGALEEGEEASAADDGDDFDVPLTELSSRNNRGGRKSGGSCDEAAVALGKIDKNIGGENGKFDRETDDVVNGTGAGVNNQITTEYQTVSSGNNLYSDTSVQKVDYHGGGKTLILNGNLGKNLKPAGGSKRGRRSKIEVEGGRNMDVRVCVNENQVDLDEKVADMHSSLSRRTRNRAAVSDNRKEEILNTLKDGEDVTTDSGDDDGIRFSVGDFVWGKIKSHPWWPGRIYDPHSASDYALNYKHEGRLLVAYFGDGTFAWCSSSQLKPFVVNFSKLSKRSSARGFIRAVDEAVYEFGKLVELRLTSVRHHRDDRPLIVNAGIKRDVHVPEGGIGSGPLIVEFKPDVLLSELRHISKSFSIPNKLELSLLKSHLSAFFQTERGYTLLQYDGPQEIGDGGRVRGPMEEEEYDDFVSESVKEDAPDNDQERPVISLRTTPKRKVKSIAELLGNDATEKVESKVDNEEGDTSRSERGKKLEKLGSKPGMGTKRNPGDEEVKSARREERTVATGSQTRRGKTRPLANVTGSEDSGGTSSLRRTTRKRNTVEEEINPAAAEEPMQNSLHLHPRERKKSRYLSPPYITPEQRQRITSSIKALQFPDVVKTGEGDMDATPIVKCRLKPASKEAAGMDLAAPKALAGGPSPNYVLSEIRSVAQNPPQFSLEERKSLEGVKGFLSSYRNSEYGRGTNYHSSYSRTLQQETHGGRRTSRKSPKEDSEPTGGPCSRKRKSEPMHTSEELPVPFKCDQMTPVSENVRKPRRGRKKKQAELDSEKAEEEGISVSSAILTLLFPPNFPMPSEDDLIAIYSKYGVLDESKTQVVDRSCSAKIFFVRSSDAEEALKSWETSDNRPFGTAQVGCKIRYLRPAAVSGSRPPDDRVNSKNSKAFAEACKQEQHPSFSSVPVAEAKTGRQAAPIGSSDADVADADGFRFVKKKLNELTSMLADQAELTDEMKSTVHNEIEEMLKRVNGGWGS